jgi:hypothetical protein
MCMRILLHEVTVSQKTRMRCRRNLHVPKPRSPGSNIPHHRGPAQGFQGISILSPSWGSHGPWSNLQESEIALPKVKYRPFFAKYSSFTHRVKLKQSGLQLEGPGQLVVSAGLRRQSGLQVQDCRFRERPVRSIYWVIVDHGYSPVSLLICVDLLLSSSPDLLSSPATTSRALKDPGTAERTYTAGDRLFMPVPRMHPPATLPHAQARKPCSSPPSLFEPVIGSRGPCGRQNFDLNATLCSSATQATFKLRSRTEPTAGTHIVPPTPGLALRT